MALTISFTHAAAFGPTARPIVECMDGQTVHYRGEDGEVAAILPSPAQWTAFGRVVDQAGVWAWAPSYFDRGICDGSAWTLELRDGRRRLKSHGFNVQPEGYEAFLRALRRLIGGRRI